MAQHGIALQKTPVWLPLPMLESTLVHESRTPGALTPTSGLHAHLHEHACTHTQMRPHENNRIKYF